MLKTFQAGDVWSQIIKYSPNGEILAIGSLDTNIYLFSIKQDYNLINICKGHTSQITHIDFGYYNNSNECTNNKLNYQIIN